MKIQTLITFAMLFCIALSGDCEENYTAGKMVGMTAGHNVRRGRHGVPDLQWDPKLATAAQVHANKCQWKHSTSADRTAAYVNAGGPNEYTGENIAYGTGTSYGPNDALDGWYESELPFWDFATATDKITKPGVEQVGHMTQIVWKGTSVMGCAVAQCSFGRFYVCQFYPGGNMQGAYKENVLAPTTANSNAAQYSAPAKLETFDGELNSNSQCPKSNVGAGSFVQQKSFCGEDVFCCPVYPCQGLSWSAASAGGKCTLTGKCTGCSNKVNWWETTQTCAGGKTTQVDPNNLAVVQSSGSSGSSSSLAKISYNLVLGLVLGLCFINKE